MGGLARLRAAICRVSLRDLTECGPLLRLVYVSVRSGIKRIMQVNCPYTYLHTAYVRYVLAIERVTRLTPLVHSSGWFADPVCVHQAYEQVPWTTIKPRSRLTR
jgi:hypothetical protein